MPSDVIDWVFISGYSSIAFSGVSVLCVILLRLRSWFNEYRQQKLWRDWRPLCLEAICGLIPAEIPKKLFTSHWLWFFRLWYHFQLNVNGEARSDLRVLARRMGAHQVAMKLLSHHASQRELVTAIVAVGLLSDTRAWELLVDFLYHDSPELSFAAARALTRINAEMALVLIIPLMSTRTDWHKQQVAALLLEVGPEAVSPPLLEAIINTPKENSANLITFLQFADVSTCNIVLFHYLLTTQDSELLCICLKAARSPKVLPLIREYLLHEHWTVRIQAANTIGQIGQAEDVDKLIPLLADSHWWVRYRSAQAIGHLIYHNKQRFDDIIQQQSDRYAIDMLTQVAAEWSWA